MNGPRSKLIILFLAIATIGTQLFGEFGGRRSENHLYEILNDFSASIHPAENNRSSYLHAEQPPKGVLVEARKGAKAIIQDGETKILTEDKVKKTIDEVQNMKKKPHLVFHVGPPKTSSNTIQGTMTVWESTGVLSKDNYKYAGFPAVDAKHQNFSSIDLTIIHKLRNKRCNREMSNARKKFAHNATSLHEIVAAVPCAMNILNTLTPFAQKGTNILVSDKAYSLRWRSYYGMPQKGALDWISLKALLSPYWNITVIVAYRRYYELLPAVKQQVDRWTQSKPKMNAWPPKGRDIETLFPNRWKNTSLHRTIVGMPFHFTDTIIKSIQQANVKNEQNVKQGNSHHAEDPINVVVFNLHELSEIDNFKSPFVRTNFVCNALPAASNICEYSRNLDLQTKPKEKKNSSQTTSYDQLTMAAARQNMINTDRAVRHDVVLAAEKYHEDLIATANNKTRVELPLLCPDENEMRDYLQRSLDYEFEILPTFFNSKYGKERHISDFWNAVEKKTFCDVDVDKALQQKHWQDFFNSA